MNLVMDALASETYRIEFRPAALRDLEALDKNTRVRVAKKIDELASNPRPAGVKTLTG